MSITTWKQLIYDCADAIRSISESTAKIAVGSIPNKIIESAEGNMIPSLTDNQKQQLINLMDSYFEKRADFVYDGSIRRESYYYPNSLSSLDNASINGCMYDGKYIINCGVFAQLIWMGRSISDFTPTPTRNITKAFDWGYYWDFLPCQLAYGVKKDASTFYTANTYLKEDGGRQFITFDNAAAMAEELYRKGYEIPYHKMDVGDLIFYRCPHISDDDTDGLEHSSFRYITPVAIVRSVDEYGPYVMESTNAYAYAIGRSGLGENATDFGHIWASGLSQRVSMVASHPAAWGNGGNVPNSFTKYRGVKANG